MVGCFVLMAGTNKVDAFTLEMSYKPPVKSSVKTLHDRRYQSFGNNGSEDDSSSSSFSNRRRPKTRKSAHAIGIAPTPTTRSGTANFEQRMRDLLFRGSKQSASISGTTKTTTSSRRKAMSIPENVRTVHNLNDYKVVVADEANRMVAVRFHATYCRACMAVAPHFYKIAKLNPDVVFVDVPVTESNASLHQGLGVPCLPYAHIYHPENGLVEEMKLTRNDIPEFREKLKYYVAGESDEDNDGGGTGTSSTVTIQALP
jgi:thiol-disulfide isomerase/thioredoxin